MFLGNLILILERKFQLTRTQVAAIINEEENLLKKYAHLELQLLKEHSKTKNLEKVILLHETLNSLVKLSPYQSDVRKTLFQRFRLPSGEVTTLIKLIQTNAVTTSEIDLALKAQAKKQTVFHSPELFSKRSA